MVSIYWYDWLFLLGKFIPEKVVLFSNTTCPEDGVLEELFFITFDSIKILNYII